MSDLRRFWNQRKFTYVFYAIASDRVVLDFEETFPIIQQLE